MYYNPLGSEARYTVDDALVLLSRGDDDLLALVIIEADDEVCWCYLHVHSVEPIIHI